MSKIYVKIFFLTCCVASAIGANVPDKKPSPVLIKSEAVVRSDKNPVVPSNIKLKKDEVVILRPKYFFLRDNIGNIQKFFPNSVKKTPGVARYRPQKRNNFNKYEDSYVDDDEYYEDDKFRLDDGPSDDYEDDSYEDEDPEPMKKPNESDGIGVDSAVNFVPVYQAQKPGRPQRPGGRPQLPQGVQFTPLGSGGGIFSFPLNLLNLFRPQNQLSQQNQQNPQYPLYPQYPQNPQYPLYPQYPPFGQLPQYQLVQLVRPTQENEKPATDTDEENEQDPQSPIEVVQVNPVWVGNKAPTIAGYHPQQLQILQLRPNQGKIQVIPGTTLEDFLEKNKRQKTKQRRQLARAKASKNPGKIIPSNVKLASYDVEHVNIHSH